MRNRREFLVLALRISLLPRAAGTLAGSLVESGAPGEFSGSDRGNLAAAMDALIPASDGMPSASMIGGVDYLQSLAWQYPDIGEHVGQFLRALAEKSSQFHEKVADLKRDQLVQVMAAMEKSDAQLFSTFLRSVYEAYYTRPQVLGLIACPNQPEDTDDLEGLLAPVRKMKRLYRDAR